MDKKDIMKYVGNMRQLAYVDRVKYGEGRAENMNSLEVKSGDILFHVMVDKCLDISDLSYKGMNMTFTSKPGLQGRNSYDTSGNEAQRSIMGGLFFTCGTENICAPCKIDGKDYPMHGRLRTTPAEHICTDAYFCGDDYIISISGEMREAELFGENMVLRRKIETHLGDNSIIITDEIENQSFRPEPLMLMYHCNMGFPFLDESSRLVIPTVDVSGREEFSEAHTDRWNEMEPPSDNEQEYVFIHKLVSDKEGNTMALVINEKYNIGLSLEWNMSNLPYFMEWKSLASGDYVMGLEPSNSSVYGKKYHVEKDMVHFVNPFEKETNVLKFKVIEGSENISLYKKIIDDIKNNKI